MSGKILVLAATGNIGRPLVRALLDRGADVLAASRSGDAPAGAEGVNLDIRDVSSVEAALARVDRAFIMLPEGYPAVTELLLPILAAAVERNVKVVLLTGFGVDADDANPWRQCEIALQKSAATHVILRPNWYFDNFHNHWKASVDEGTLALPAGDGHTSFVDIRDVAECAAVVLTTDRFDGQAIELTGARTWSYPEAASQLSEALGRPIAYVPISETEFLEGLSSVGVPDGVALALAACFVPVREGWTMGITDGVKRVTGRSPRSLHDDLAEHLADLGAAEHDATTEGVLEEAVWS